jgi:hypothetical protein
VDAWLALEAVQASRTAAGLLKQGKLPQAVAAYRRAAVLAPNNAEIRARLSDVERLVAGQDERPDTRASKATGDTPPK